MYYFKVFIYYVQFYIIVIVEDRLAINQIFGLFRKHF